MGGSGYRTGECVHPTAPGLECAICAAFKRAPKMASDDAELSALRARVAELEADRNRYTGDDGEADPLAVILESYAGIEGLGPTGKVVRGLVAEVRKLQGDRDAARRDLEAATRFGFVRSDGALVQATLNHNGKTWCVTVDGGIAGEGWLSTTRDAALAEARRLAGIT